MHDFPFDPLLLDRPARGTVWPVQGAYALAAYIRIRGRSSNLQTYGTLGVKNGLNEEIQVWMGSQLFCSVHSETCGVQIAVPMDTRERVTAMHQALGGIRDYLDHDRRALLCQECHSGIVCNTLSDGDTVLAQWCYDCTVDPAAYRKESPA